MKENKGSILSWKIVIIMISITCGFLLSEFIIRLLNTQGLTGTWYVVSKDGYICNTKNRHIMHQSLNRTVYYQFNNHHLRGGQIKVNSCKILVLGDSFTFGWLLNEADTYVSRLQKYADDDFGKDFFQFLNGGVGGRGTADFIAFVEEYGAEISPAVIVVFLNTDDIGRSIRNGIYKLNPKGGLDKAKPDLELGVRIRYFLQNNPLYHWHTMQLIRKIIFYTRNYFGYHNNIGIENGPISFDLKIDPILSVRLGQALFHRLNNWCKSHGIKLIILTTGNFDKHNMNENEPTMAFFLKAKQLFSQEGISYHDISPEVMTAKNGRPHDFIIDNDGHPNEAGSQLIARYSWQWLHPRLSNLAHEMKRKGRGENVSQD